MSAVGALPGFTYPEFDFGEAEFMEIVTPNVTVAAGPTVNIPLLTAGSGSAVFIRVVHALFGASAAAGTRLYDFMILDANGIEAVRYRNPQQSGPGASGAVAWSISVSAGSVTSAVGICPLPQAILPPGWSAQIQLLTAAAGDTLTSIVTLGLRIPNAVTPVRNLPTIPTPILI